MLTPFTERNYDEVYRFFPVYLTIHSISLCRIPLLNPLSGKSRFSAC
jgi:hypothetical protein